MLGHRPSSRRLPGRIQGYGIFHQAPISLEDTLRCVPFAIQTRNMNFIEGASGIGGQDLPWFVDVSRDIEFLNPYGERRGMIGSCAGAFDFGPNGTFETCIRTMHLTAACRPNTNY